MADAFGATSETTFGTPGGNITYVTGPDGQPIAVGPDGQPLPDYLQAGAGPFGADTPINETWNPGTPGYQWQQARGLMQQRIGGAQDYAARVRAGQSAAAAQQALGLGGVQQQAIAASVGRPLAARAAMYGQGRAADQQIAQQAGARAREAQAAEAMRQEALGAGRQQYMSEADQMLQIYGIQQNQRMAQAQEAQAASQANEAETQQAIGTAVGVAGTLAAAASDRQLKLDVARPNTLQERRLIEALRGY